MARFIKGDVVILPFPFSDLTEQKRRPAFVVQPVANDDLILCQITSRLKRDDDSIGLKTIDFVEGGLPLDSYVRPNRLFTADENIVLRKAGRLRNESIKEIIDRLVMILQR